MTLAINTTIIDPNSRTSLLLLDVLGHGSYATVYLAKDTSSNYTSFASKKLFAVKAVDKTTLDETQIQYSREEIFIHSSLRHPNIISLHRSFETSTHIFLVMEYVKGKDMYDWILDNCNHEDPRSKTYSEFQKKRRLFSQCLSAVEYCHKQSVYHRDVKPENFYITDSGSVKLLDFGLATQDRFSAEFECGSNPYMSHECRSGYSHYSTPHSDVWALGIIFINLFYCQCPWPEPDPQNPVFQEFLEAPIEFLLSKFLFSVDVAEFLANRVFCDENSRCSISELKRWFSSLNSRSIYAPSRPKTVPTVSPSLNTFSVDLSSADTFAFSCDNPGMSSTETLNGISAAKVSVNTRDSFSKSSSSLTDTESPDNHSHSPSDQLVNNVTTQPSPIDVQPSSTFLSIPSHSNCSEKTVAPIDIPNGLSWFESTLIEDQTLQSANCLLSYFPRTDSEDLLCQTFSESLVLPKHVQHHHDYDNLFVIDDIV